LKGSPTRETHFILLAHGSPDPRWRETFEQGLATMRPGLNNETSLAYMEMATPSLADIVAYEHSRGVREFAIVPLFFATGRHLRIDVPLQIEALRSNFAGIDIQMHEPVGKDSAFWGFLLTFLNNK
jgi:sirohydrochlorin cobaltochelatase